MMSLLEDVFLQDEAGEAQELERIIEGDEYYERPRPVSPDSDANSEKEDEAEEDKRHVELASAKPKRVVKNPRIVLNPARLIGPRGIQIIPEHFKDFKFKGKGHEKEDLDLVLKNLEHWAYRLFPKFQFADCLKKIETLGNKRPVMVHLTKIRTDQFMSEDTVVQRDSSDDEAPLEPVQEEDEFDKLLRQQIELTRAKPAPGSTMKPAISTPMVDRVVTMPKAISSPSINEEQRERMLRNRQLAEERRLARLKQNTSETDTSVQDSDTITNDNPVKNVANLSELNTSQENGISAFSDHIIDEDDISKVKNNRSNVIDSSDEDDALFINESVTVDVHNWNRDHSEEIIENTGETSGINDVEMNDVIKVTEENKVNSRLDTSESDDNIEETDNSDKIEVITDDNRKTNVEEIASSDINTEILETDNSNHHELLKNPNENNAEYDSNEVKCEQNQGALQDTEEIDLQGVEQENNVEDIMDIDFSDDF